MHTPYGLIGDSRNGRHYRPDATGIDGNGVAKLRYATEEWVDSQITDLRNFISEFWHVSKKRGVGDQSRQMGNFAFIYLFLLARHSRVGCIRGPAGRLMPRRWRQRGGITGSRSSLAPPCRPTSRSTQPRGFMLMGRADETGVLANPRRAYWCVQVLRIVMKYGKGLRNAACAELSGILTDIEFPTPKGRKQAMRAVQAEAIIAKAHEAGLPKLALAAALAVWLRAAPEGHHRRMDQDAGWRAVGRAASFGKNTSNQTGGLRLEDQLHRDRRIRPPPLTDGHDATTARPCDEPHRAVILDERTGKPYRQCGFARRFRALARAAGVPDDVWSMDARAPVR